MEVKGFGIRRVKRGIIYLYRHRKAFPAANELSSLVVIKILSRR